MSESTPVSKPIVAPPPLDNGPKYGLHRHHSPRRYSCDHDGCGGAASTLARAGEHQVTKADGTTHDRTHNCCGGHGATDPATGS